MSPNPEDVTMIQFLSEQRVTLHGQIKAIDEKLAQPAKPKCIAELILAKRKLQEARHWLGECLGFYPTGYQKTDLAGEPATRSRAIVPNGAAA